MSRELAQADVIVIATIENPNDDGGKTSKLHVLAVWKDKTNGIKRGDVYTVPRYNPAENPKPRYLVFGEVARGEVNFYRGWPASESEMLYLKGLAQVQTYGPPAILRHAFHHLLHPDDTVRQSAWREWTDAKPTDLQAFASGLRAADLELALASAAVTGENLAFLGRMAGETGFQSLAEPLRRRIDRELAAASPRFIDGLLAGYLMLDVKARTESAQDPTRNRPSKVIELLHHLASDPNRDFLTRYSVLRVTRFAHECPGLLNQDEYARLMLPFLDQADIADLAIEEFRKAGRWDFSDRVFDLNARPCQDTPLTRRSMIRFALSCPRGNTRAATYLLLMRGFDPDGVERAEFALNDEVAAQADPMK
jgi:hypothetical protein